MRNPVVLSGAVAFPAATLLDPAPDKPAIEGQKSVQDARQHSLNGC